MKYNGKVIASENYEQWQRADGGGGELLKPNANDVSGIQLLNTIIRGTDLSGITIGDGNSADVVSIRVGDGQLGCKASALFSFAEGAGNTADASYAVAMGDIAIRQMRDLRGGDGRHQYG